MLVRTNKQTQWVERVVANLLSSHIEACTVSVRRRRVDNWDSSNSSSSRHDQGRDKGLHDEYKSGERFKNKVGSNQ